MRGRNEERSLRGENVRARRDEQNQQSLAASGWLWRSLEGPRGGLLRAGKEWHGGGPTGWGQELKRGEDREDAPPRGGTKGGRERKGQKDLWEGREDSQERSGWNFSLVAEVVGGGSKGPLSSSDPSGWNRPGP